MFQEREGESENNRISLETFSTTFWNHWSRGESK